MSLDEFAIINTYFKRKSNRSNVIVGVGDDCAVLAPSPDHYLLATTDTLTQNVHFYPDTSAEDVGYKAVAVSLSDLAAMGGEPAWALLSLSLPEANPDWLQAFANGLFNCLETYAVDLVGGNISKGPLAVTTQLFGFTVNRHYLTRKGANPGDLIFITGYLGESGLALGLLNHQLTDYPFSEQERAALIKRLWRPVPRIALGKRLVTVASAAIDISDGLAADLQHILMASKVGARIYLDAIPVASTLKRLPHEIQTRLLLSAGDDYELCFTIPKAPVKTVEGFASGDVPITCIGEITKEPGLKILSASGSELQLMTQGYKHFYNKESTGD